MGNGKLSLLFYLLNIIVLFLVPSPTQSTNSFPTMESVKNIDRISTLSHEMWNERL